MVVANWILGNSGFVPRLFEFKTPFAMTEQACAGQFASHSLQAMQRSSPVG